MHLVWQPTEHTMDRPRVTITEEGRSGTVSYEEGVQRISGWWEFAGGDAIAIVSMGDEASWQRVHPWAAERRAEILRVVADQVVRQKASGSRADIDEEGGWIAIRR